MSYYIHMNWPCASSPGTRERETRSSDHRKVPTLTAATAAPGLAAPVFAAVPGLEPRIAAAMDDDLEEGEEGTGLTQAAAGMAVHAPLPAPPAPGPPPPTPVPAELPAGLLQTLIEESISKYSELVSAVRATTARPGPMLTSSQIASWTSLHELLLHLAYLPEAACPWRRLGFAPL